MPRATPRIPRSPAPASERTDGVYGPRPRSWLAGGSPGSLRPRPPRGRIQQRRSRTAAVTLFTPVLCTNPHPHVLRELVLHVFHGPLFLKVSFKERGQKTSYSPCLCREPSGHNGGSDLRPPPSIPNPSCPEYAALGGLPRVVIQTLLLEGSLSSW